MSVATRIDQDLTTAMRDSNASRLAVLRLLKSSLKNEQIKLGHELSEAEANKVLAREAKQRRDSVEAYKQGARDDLAKSEEAELAIIADYLPAQMDDAELAKLVDQAIAETDATSMAQMGAVIGKVMQLAGGSADGGSVSRMVKEKLGS